jgi:ferric-dicitrate binding protein FerR (iron transport regulator)
MTPKDEQVRAVVAEQAAGWFVENDAGPLDGRESAELVAWLKTSPVNVEEFLGVTVIARPRVSKVVPPELKIDLQPV